MKSSSAGNLSSNNLSIEPSVLRTLTEEQKNRLTEILDQYLTALEHGAAPPLEQLTSKHPDLAEPLQLYLDELRALHDAAANAGRATPAVVDEPTYGPGQRRLGDFLLGDEIGRGGMGVVYEAQQISLGRRVALKVLPFAAVLDAKQIARFKNEARAAAQLQHPNIVPVYAIGAERGVHYFAMRLIDGRPLDAVIREWRGFGKSTNPRERDIESFPKSVSPKSSTVRVGRTRATRSQRERYESVLRLGIQAAEALHAAHEFGIVHRDVKPSNLLLDDEGKLWVTDFGLARIQSDVQVSRSGDVVGTLRYMSPEQARGDSTLVDHRTDVYSLGATLYELLALRPALGEEDRPELLRKLENEEPPRLSQWCRDIPPDLETVVRKAMSKQRDERYATAWDLAADLRCVLDGKPTMARPPTVAQRLRKWGRRHRKWVASAVIAGLLLVVGSLTATVLVLREKQNAERNFARAEQNLQDAREAVDRLVQSAQQLGDVPGADGVRRELLRQALGYYEGFVGQASHDRTLRADMALTLSKIGTLSAEIGSASEETSAHASAVQLYRELAEENPAKLDYRRRWALALNNYAQAQRNSGLTEAARRAYEQAIQLQENLLPLQPDQRQLLGDLALSHGNLGLLQTELGAMDRAERELREAIRLQQRLLTFEPENAEFKRQLAASLNNLSAVYVEQQPARAVEYHRQALALQTQAATAQPTKWKYKADVALTWNNLGATQTRLPKSAEAIESYRQAIEIQRRLVDDWPLHKTVRRDLAVSLNNLGLLYRQQRQFPEAEQSFRQALDLFEPLVEQFPDEVALESGAGSTWSNLGNLLEDLGRWDDAAQALRQAIDHQAVASTRANNIVSYRDFLSRHYYNLGRVLRTLDRLDEAVEVALERKKLWPGDPKRLISVAEELALASGRTVNSGKGDNVAAGDRAAAQPANADRWKVLAIDVLEEAVAAGYELPGDLERNESFAALRGQERFQRLCK